tara:strand:- start:1859 stop:2116 length:258 start_codon:yes stop_codon:yes gene_type:complete
MSQDNVVTHGGYRKGAGRKTKYEKTVVMRVPEKYKDAIKSLIEHLDESEMIDKNYAATTSEPVFIRSLMDKPQSITFTVTPVKKD